MTLPVGYVAVCVSGLFQGQMLLVAAVPVPQIWLLTS